jgi:Tfp pilus assembly protein PilV
MVEVLVTALVVLLVAAATVSSIGASQRTSGKTLARGISASLAEQDQERMKSFRASDLADYAATRTVSQQGIQYTVESKSEFVQDNSNGNGTGDTVSCTSTGKQSQAMRLTTTVTPQASLGAQPLTIKSLYALPVSQYSPTSGTLVAQIYRADGVTGQAGIDVQISGPSSARMTTNAKGCSVFQFRPPGAYSINVNQPGFVSQSLAQNFTYSGTVSPGLVNQATPLLYDRAGSITATFDGAATSKGGGISVSNSGIPAPSTRTYATSVANGLFPFTGPYNAYSGTCAANDPTAYNANYYTAAPGLSSKAVVPVAGAVAVDLHEPMVNATATVKPNTGSTFTNTKIHLKAKDSGCTLTDSKALAAAGGAYNVRLPYGNYALCAETVRSYPSNSNLNGTYYTLDTAVPNTVAAGTPNQALTLDVTATTTTKRGSCTTVTW